MKKLFLILSILLSFTCIQHVSAQKQKYEFKGKIIDFFTASLEDIVIAKLCSYRPTDREDITSPTVVNAIDWEKLRFLATSEGEAKASALNETRYKEFLYSFEEYERRFRPCDN